MMIRPYRRGDEPALVELFRTVFGKAMTVEHWRWKLRPAWTDTENVFVATVDDRPIFQYAGIPVRVHTPDGLANAMVSVDTMTHPSFQRRGLLTSVGAEAYRHWKRGGVRFVYGVPNPNWGSRAFALGWRFLLYLRCWIRPLRPAALLARKLGLTLPRVDVGPHGRPALEPITKADARFDMLWARWIGRNPSCISIIRDARWVQWRFIEAPHHAYEVYALPRGNDIAGYAVLRIAEEERAGYVPELLSDDGASARTLLRGLASIARARGAEKLQVLCAEGSERERSFWRAGFVVPRDRITVQLVPLGEAASADSYRPLAWQVMGSDFDFQ
jgi:hypothetical protein